MYIHNGKQLTLKQQTNRWRCEQDKSSPMHARHYPQCNIIISFFSQKVSEVYRNSNCLIFYSIYTLFKQPTCDFPHVVWVNIEKYFECKFESSFFSCGQVLKSRFALSQVSVKFKRKYTSWQNILSEISSGSTSVLRRMCTNTDTKL